MQSVPLFVPGVLLSISLALLASPGLANRLGISRAHAALLILAIGAILSATLTPQEGALQGVLGSGRCDFSRWRPAPLREYVAGGDIEGNVLLFLPLGVAVGLMPSRGPRLRLLLFGLILPFAIEGIQLVLPILDRACESADVVDNGLGMLLGFGGARLAALAVGAMRRGTGRTSDHAGDGSATAR
jgi:hypothetical protein